MLTRVDVYSERKGSNPGGKVRLSRGKQSIDAYVKYCTGTRTGNFNFTATHQPIYEALTLAWAESLGLKVPNFYVLKNEGQIQFNYVDRRIPRWNEKMPFYLVSELASLENETDSLELKNKLKKEKLYRDLLGITDVSGKRQNFGLVQTDDGKEVIYVDLGCSFVYAVEGYLRLKKGMFRDVSNKRARKRNLKKIVEHEIATNRWENIVPLAEVLTFPRRANIPLLGKGRLKEVPLVDLLKENEIEEIMAIIEVEMTSAIRRHSTLGTEELFRT